MKHPSGTVATFGSLRVDVTEGLIVLQGAKLDERVILTRPDAQIWANLLGSASGHVTLPLLVSALRQAALASRDASAMVHVEAEAEMPETYDLRLQGKQPRKPK